MLALGEGEIGYKNIRVEKRGKVGLITLDRPKAMNALNSELIAELGAALDGFDEDERIGCVVITGSEKAFAAGADIKMMSSKNFTEVFSEDLFGEVADVFARTRKPIIAAVSGYALGGGCELAMMCDFIIASESAKFGQPEINLGVMAGLGGSQRLTRFVGKSKAMEMNLTGRFMDAEEAERAGLVSRVVPVDKLFDDAVATAAKIASKSALASMAAKEAVNAAYELDLTIADYSEHSLQSGSDASAVAYMEVTAPDRERSWYGVGINGNIVAASLEGAISAANRVLTHDL